MDTVVLVGVDGSDAATRAAQVGLDRLRPADRVVVATVVEGADPTLVTGVSGMAGGAVAPDQLAEMNEERLREGEAVAHRAVEALALEGAEALVAIGDPGVELATLATDLGASVVVVGSRGRGGIARALLGSVSDHLVRHAPCPVLIVRDDED